MALPKYQNKATPKAEAQKQGKKRAPSPAGSPGKKRKSEIASAAAAKQKVIAKAISDVQCVPTSVRELLCSALPGCCSVTAEFHPFQERMLRMLSQTLQEIQADKTCEFQKAAGVLTHTKEEVDCLEKEHASAEGAVAASTATAQEESATLSCCGTTAQVCQSAYQEAQTELQRGDAAIGDAVMQIERLRAARAQMGKVTADTALATLQDLCSGWGLGLETLGNLTLLEGEVCQRLSKLSEMTSKAGVARVPLAAGVAAAQARLEAAKNEKVACAVALAQTQAGQADQAAILKTKARSLKQCKAILAQTIRTWQSAQRSLTDFHKAWAAFKDIANQVEQRHGIKLSNVTEMVAANSSEGKDLTMSELFPNGTPVIDRRQRHAVLRRRSAVLPMGSFSRLSLMARRSSFISASQCMDTGNDNDEGAPGNQMEEEPTAKPREVMLNGNPVIDRRQRHAVLRRRSAALPMGSFSRLSLMARRSSFISASECIDISNDAEDGALETQTKEQRGQKALVLDDAMHVPTPNRNSLSA